MLCDDQEEYRLAQLGKVSLKIVKGYVVGSSRAGKTFALAVTGSGDASNVSERTPGIDIKEVILEKVGHRLKLHDRAPATTTYFIPRTVSSLVECLPSLFTLWTRIALALCPATDDLRHWHRYLALRACVTQFERRAAFSRYPDGLYENVI